MKFQHKVAWPLYVHSLLIFIIVAPLSRSQVPFLIIIFILYNYQHKVAGLFYVVFYGRIVIMLLKNIIIFILPSNFISSPRN